MNEWMDEAACADSPLNFTPESADWRAQWAAAKVCARECPVRQACARFAAEHKGDLWGVYAGVFHDGRKVRVITRPVNSEAASARSREAYRRNKESAA